MKGELKEDKRRKNNMTHTRKKKQIISEIEMEDEKQGHFYKDGHYRYGIKFYYGKLDKYPKEKLEKILSNLKKSGKKL